MAEEEKKEKTEYQKFIERSAIEIESKEKVIRPGSVKPIHIYKEDKTFYSFLSLSDTPEKYPKYSAGYIVSIKQNEKGLEFLSSVKWDHSASKLDVDGSLNLNASGNIRKNNIQIFSTHETLFNVTLGTYAGYSITTGNYNICVGYEAGKGLSSGSRNVLIGYRAGRLLTTPNNNFFFGMNCGHKATTAHENVGIGTNVFAELLVGYNNVGIGYAAGNRVTGDHNTFIGEEAGYTCSTGSKNTSIGRAALLLCQTGISNVAIGYEAGRGLLGSYNVCIGYQAGRAETGSYKLYIDISNTATPLIYGEFDNRIVKIYNYFYLPNIKSGATQAAAGANASEFWKTIGHASLPDNVVMIGV